MLAIDGYTHRKFRPLVSRFMRLYRKDRNGGGALCVYVQGELAVDVWAGLANVSARRPWRGDTMAMSFSTSKGVASTLVHRLVEKDVIAYDEPIATYWPEFAAHGKQAITVDHLLTHTAGLHDARSIVHHWEEAFDHKLMAQRLADSPARRPPGERPGYHGITYGWLVAGLVEHATGRDFRDVLREELAEPLGADGLFIGTPEEERHRLAELRPQHLTPGGLPLDGLARRATIVPRMRALADALLVHGMDKVLLNPRVYDTVLPAANGTFTARSLGKMYGALANGGEVDGVRLFKPETVREMGRVQRRELDYVLQIPMRWRRGYHQGFVAGRPQPKAFGHFGFGGSGGWADPETGLAIAFITNRLGNATTPVGDARLPRLGAFARKLVLEG